MAQNFDGLSGSTDDAVNALLAAQFYLQTFSSHANVQQQLNSNAVQQQAYQQSHQLEIEQNLSQILSLSMYDNMSMSSSVGQQFNYPALPLPKLARTPSKSFINVNEAGDGGNNFNMKSYDNMFNSSVFKTPTKADSSFKSLCELQRVAIHGCDTASKVFQCHSKRPYFKKIDLICDRLKQDLSITNKAVININSHGVAWAIKDFIFIFNRIISAWVIMRDYFYSASEGMECVRNGIDPSFNQDFLNWQEATSKLAKTLVQSYENLHCKDQRNGNRKICKESPIKSTNSGGSNDPFQKIFDPSIASNSAQAQLSGDYLKSAVYKPLSTSSDESSPPDTPNSTHDYESFKLMFNELLPDNGFMERSGAPKPLYKRGGAESTPAGHSQFMDQSRLKTKLECKFGSIVEDDSTDLSGICPFRTIDD